MQAFKIVFVAVFALCAIQAQTAELPELRNATHLNIRLFVVNGAAIAKNLFTAINSGLDKSKPNMDLILNELEPEFKGLLRKKIDQVRAFIHGEEKQIDHIFKTLDKALDDMKPIKPCYDKFSPDAKNLTQRTENQIYNMIFETTLFYKDELVFIKNSTSQSVKTLRKLFDTEVDAVVKCLKPGRKDAKDCVNKSVERTVKGIFAYIINIQQMISYADSNLQHMYLDFFKKSEEIFSNFIKDAKPLVGNLAECVSKMK